MIPWSLSFCRPPHHWLWVDLETSVVLIRVSCRVRLRINAHKYRRWFYLHHSILIFQAAKRKNRITVNTSTSSPQYYASMSACKNNNNFDNDNNIICAVCIRHRLWHWYRYLLNLLNLLIIIIPTYRLNIIKLYIYSNS